MQIYSWSSPWGSLPVAVENGRICAIALDPRAPFAPLATGGAARRAAGPIASAHDVSRILNAGLRGQLSARERLAAVDLSWATEFEQRVLRALAGVRFGATVTYGELAEASGSPRAARAVGGALGKNRVPVLIPCHRVLASNGIGGFGGGAGSSWRPGATDPIAFKRALLRGEGVDA
jgi:methylated-DNA-[protein]-cysteine S-methyltransferase